MPSNRFFFYKILDKLSNIIYNIISTNQIILIFFLKKYIMTNKEIKKAIYVKFNTKDISVKNTQGWCNIKTSNRSLICSIQAYISTLLDSEYVVVSGK